MRRPLLPLLALPFIALVLIAPARGQSGTATQTPAAQADTQLVVIDVVVQDRDGHPVRHLTADSFHLTEVHTPQTLRSFEEHSSLTPPPHPTKPLVLPPGTFTDYTPVPPNGTLNVLLIDALNTPAKDRAFIRNQLKDYVSKARPGTRIAIFGLGSQVVMLQGFTADPSMLRDAVERRLLPRASTEQSGTLAQTAANLSLFEAQTALQTNLRAQYTLDALNTLAHYLAGFPGRKNLLWFSGAFPIDVLPDGSLQHPFATPSNADEFRQTVTLLGKAQVAVYPIDAGSLISGLPTNPADATTAHLAEATGGQVIDNTTSLADAVSHAIDAGANYYTLTYTPAELHAPGSYQPLHVDLTAGDTLKLSYRRGYYTDAPPLTDAAHTAYAYLHAAVAHGAPTPQDILFKVRALPASTATELTLAPGNTPNPNGGLPGPYQRLALDFATLASQFNLHLQPDGRRTGSIEFLAYVYNARGVLLNVAARTLQLNLSPDTYRRFLTSNLQMHLDLDTPSRMESYLRLAVRDPATNRLGVLEFPASTLSRLPPAPAFTTTPPR